METLDDLILKPEFFSFEKVRSIILTRNTLLSRLETIQLLNLVEHIYTEKLKEYEDNHSLLFLEEDYFKIIFNLKDSQNWKYDEFKNVSISNSVLKFFIASANLIEQLFYDRKSNKFKQTNLNFKIPKPHISTLKQEETALLFLSLQKLKVIHEDVTKKDLALLINGLTGYANTAMVGTLSKTYSENLKLNPGIIDKLLVIIKLLESELSNLKSKK